MSFWNQTFSNSIDTRCRSAVIDSLYVKNDETDAYERITPGGGPAPSPTPTPVELPGWVASSGPDFGNTRMTEDRVIVSLNGNAAILDPGSVIASDNAGYSQLLPSKVQVRNDLDNSVSSLENKKLIIENSELNKTTIDSANAIKNATSAASVSTDKLLTKSVDNSYKLIDIPSPGAVVPAWVKTSSAEFTDGTNTNKINASSSIITSTAGGSTTTVNTTSVGIANTNNYTRMTPTALTTFSNLTSTQASLAPDKLTINTKVLDSTGIDSVNAIKAATAATSVSTDKLLAKTNTGTYKLIDIPSGGSSADVPSWVKTNEAKFDDGAGSTTTLNKDYISFLNPGASASVAANQVIVYNNAGAQTAELQGGKLILNNTHELNQDSVVTVNKIKNAIASAATSADKLLARNTNGDYKLIDSNNIIRSKRITVNFATFLKVFGRNTGQVAYPVIYDNLDEIYFTSNGVDDSLDNNLVYNQWFAFRVTTAGYNFAMKMEIIDNFRLNWDAPNAGETTGEGQYNIARIYWYVLRENEYIGTGTYRLTPGTVLFCLLNTNTTYSTGDIFKGRIRVKVFTRDFQAVPI